MSLVITGHVTRTELALANLALNDDTYKIIRGGFGPGPTIWKRQTAASPFMHGRALTHAVKEQSTTFLGIRVKGASEADAMTKLGTLLDAFEQFSYELTVTIGGTTFTYDCEPADYEVGEGGSIQNFHLMAFQQEVALEIPHHPVPVAGPF